MIGQMNRVIDSHLGARTTGKAEHTGLESVSPGTRCTSDFKSLVIQQLHHRAEHLQFHRMQRAELSCALGGWPKCSGRGSTESEAGS